MPGKLRAVIVDDEPLARQGIRGFLSGDPSVKLVGECRDGVDAIKFFSDHTADLLFLDIQMPEVNGFEVLESISPPRMIVFVTAYDKYAVEAFNVHAFDYLLKPIDPDRFTEVLNRAKTEFGRDSRRDGKSKLLPLLSAMRAHEGRPERLVVRAAGRMHFLPTSEVDWIEAAGDYAYLHVKGKKILHRKTMHELEQRLAPGNFCRIHRSTIVNLSCIKELQPLTHGEGILHLRDGTRLDVSRTYRQRLVALLSL